MTLDEYNSAVDEWADRVYRFVVKSMRDEDGARDVVQDSYEKMWRHRENIDGTKVKTYLFTTAYHTMIDRIRKSNREVIGDPSEHVIRHERNGFSDLQEVLHEAISRLPEKQRSVVLLRDYEGYSYREIADVSGLTEAQVKVYIYRARVFLKKYIGSIDVVV